MPFTYLPVWRSKFKHNITIVIGHEKCLSYQCFIIFWWDTTLIFNKDRCSLTWTNQSLTNNKKGLLNAVVCRPIRYISTAMISQKVEGLATHWVVSGHDIVYLVDVDRLSICRTPERRNRSSRVHPQDVCRFEPG